MAFGRGPMTAAIGGNGPVGEQIFGDVSPFSVFLVYFGPNFGVVYFVRRLIRCPAAVPILMSTLL